MTILIYILVFLIGFTALVFIIGLLLPKERVVTCETIYNAPPEIVYDIVTDNENWTYRSELENLEITERSGEKEVWIETTRDGAVTTFRTLEKKPCSFYSFSMENKMFRGYWTADFIPEDRDKTLFRAEEHISVKNSFVKAVSYVFFDIRRLMEQYQENLRFEIERKTMRLTR